MKKIAILVCSVLLFVIACTHKTYLTPTVHSTDTTHTTTPIGTDTMTNASDTSVCFARDVLAIFTTNCAKSGCHDAASQKKGYIFTSYSTITAKGLVRGSANTSEIYAVCVSGSMPKGAARFDSTQLSLIARWINEGAPDDTNCTSICDTTFFTYSGSVQPILKEYCYGCHTSSVAAAEGGGFVLDNYDSVYAKAQNGMLLGTVQHQSPYPNMPLTGAALAPCMITQIRKWISAGAMNN